jgi:hypothetical protein
VSHGRFVPRVLDRENGPNSRCDTPCLLFGSGRRDGVLGNGQVLVGVPLEKQFFGYRGGERAAHGGQAVLPGGLGCHADGPPHRSDGGQLFARRGVVKPEAAEGGGAALRLSWPDLRFL